MPNMNYCMFENTSNDMQEIIDRMYEEGFNPNSLSNRERRAFEALYDQCSTMIERLEELEEEEYERNIALEMDDDEELKIHNKLMSSKSDGEM